MRLDDELDRLYRCPLADFVAHRNELARRLRNAGDREAADRVKKLAKPSVTAWAVNQLHFRARDELDALLESGENLKRAHLTDAEAHRAGTRVKRAALSKLLTIAGDILGEHGSALGRVYRQRISQSLEALASGAEGAVPGRLSQDLEPPGFDALSNLAASLDKPPPDLAREPAKFRSRPVAVVPRDADAEPAEVVDLGAERRARARMHEQELERRRARREQRLAEARRAVRDGEVEMASLERKTRDAGTALASADEAARKAAEVAEDAERRAREARDAARAAAESVRENRLQAEALRASLERARGRLEEAQRALERLAREGTRPGPEASSE